ncbi:MAG: peptidoglycan DD-metalloendopeptidase family protein [Pseudomonadales bacterium]|nr:peptidoglycan DD-metalloendopeptidase family protein [Pseudomonadales bacterium]
MPKKIYTAVLCYGRQTRSQCRLRIAANLLVLLPFTLALLSHPPLLLAESEIESRQAELLEVQAAAEQLQKTIAAKRGQRSTTLKKFKRSEQRIGELGALIFTLKKEQRALEKDIQTLQKAIEASKHKQLTQREQIAKQLRAAYMSGKQKELAILFSNTGPAELSRQLHYLGRINRARSELIDEYSDLIEHQQALLQSAAEQERKSQSNRRKIEEQQRKIAAQQQRRSELLAKLEKQISDGDRKLSTLLGDSEDLQALIETMSKALARRANEQQAREAGRSAITAVAGSFSAAKGQLPWPVSGRQHAAFGRQDSLSGLTSRGVRIAARSGDSVHAIFAGQVIFADWFGGQGLLTIVDHGSGYWSLYGHNQSLLKTVGAQVSAGEAIATVGNSGGRSDAALYFEIRHNGKPTDPALWCRR